MQLSCFSEWKIWITYELHLVIFSLPHYTDVTMSPMASQITSLGIVYSTVYSDADQRKHQSSASLTFVRRIHRGPVNSPHKRPVTRKMFPFDDVIMLLKNQCFTSSLMYSYIGLTDKVVPLFFCFVLWISVNKSLLNKRMCMYNSLQ